MSGKELVRVAIIGTAKRSDYHYGPILQAMPHDVSLVGVWGRSVEPSRRLGEGLNVPWYTDMNRLVSETAPQIGVVCVKGQANGEVGLMAVECGLHILIETPIAYDLGEADAILAAAKRRNLKVEVAEQFHRRPMEQIKLKLIEAGIFGRIYSSFSDFAGHGYHGMSVMRSYLGFDAVPVRVTAFAGRYELAPHLARTKDTRGARIETQEHALVEFEGGRIGVFHWSNAGYDSGVRWWRSSRFLGEKGMGVSIGTAAETQMYLTVLAPDCEAPLPITVERRYERVDGGVLTGVVAHTNDPERPTIAWENPFLAGGREGHRPLWQDDEIGVAGCIMSLVNAVRDGGEPGYGGLQGRLDQALVVAMQESARNGGTPISL